ncbi:uncharacterized protein V6R79_014883 [Siganus canaliculatus]
MADFPSKVTTETSASQAQFSQQGGNSLRGLATSVTYRMDLSFFKSLQAILMMAEIVVGMLHWALVCSAHYTALAAYGWVLFVAITLWLLTIALFLIILFGVPQRLTSIPWSMTVMIFHGVAAVLYLTAFLANAASVNPFKALFPHSYNLTAAGAFFAAVVTLLYGASAFFSYMDWRGDGGNAATSTVPT